MSIEPKPYTSPIAFMPGEILIDILQSRGISPQRLAEKSGLSISIIRLIVNGKQIITAEIADGLKKALGIKASFWLNAQRQYDETRARLAGESGGD